MADAYSSYAGTCFAIELCSKRDKQMPSLSTSVAIERRSGNQTAPQNGTRTRLFCGRRSPSSLCGGVLDAVSGEENEGQQTSEECRQFQL